MYSSACTLGTKYIPRALPLVPVVGQVQLGPVFLGILHGLQQGRPKPRTRSDAFGIKCVARHSTHFSPGNMAGKHPSKSSSGFVDRDNLRHRPLANEPFLDLPGQSAPTAGVVYLDKPA